MYIVPVTFLVASVYTGGHKWPVHLVFGPDDTPVPTQLYRSARLRRMRSSKKVSVHLRLSLALLARKTPPLAMGHAKAKPCRGREGKKGEGCCCCCCLHIKNHPGLSAQYPHLSVLIQH